VAARVAAVVAVSAPEVGAVAQPSRGLPEAVAVVDFAPVVVAEAPVASAPVVAVADTPIAAADIAAVAVIIAAEVASFRVPSRVR
jgi:hypothetical protein